MPFRLTFFVGNLQIVLIIAIDSGGCATLDSCWFSSHWNKKKKTTQKLQCNDYDWKDFEDRCAFSFYWKITHFKSVDELVEFFDRLLNTLLCKLSSVCHGMHDVSECQCVLHTRSILDMNFSLGQTCLGLPQLFWPHIFEIDVDLVVDCQSTHGTNYKPRATHLLWYGSNKQSLFVQCSVR